MRKSGTVVSLTLVTCLVFAMSANAQRLAKAADYPNKPVRLIVPSAPGSGTDGVGRMIGEGLSNSWGVSVVVDNRVGAGGIRAVTMIAKDTQRDGYTMMLGSIGHFSFAPVLRSKLPYDPYKDLAPISLVATQPFVIVVSPSVPAGSIKELIAYAKSRPGEIRYGSGGAGTAIHLGTELLQLAAAISMLHVPYRGSGPAMAALMGGEIDFLMPGLAQTKALMGSGKVKVLALTSAKRSSAAPDLPTVAESGVSGFAFDVWYGLVFPSKVPRPILLKASSDIAKVLVSPEVSKRFSRLGLEPTSTTPDEFSTLIRNDSRKWARVVKDANIKIQ